MSRSVIVGISGGVDSAVAALLLKQQGYDVQGLFMANWDDDDDYCTAAQDFQDARSVCAKLGVALHRVSFAADYRERVFAHFLREYEAGRTPNPDVLCNREIKFGVCLDYMRRLGADLIATGHYARIVRGATGADLCKAADLGKDQSYFLHAVSREAFERTLFPLGELTKPQVRALAHEHGIPVHAKPDSTGICFIGERPFAEFLSKFVASRPGPIEDDLGAVIGEHRGLSFYTIGQRSGLGIGGRANAQAAPWYVAGKDMARNALVVVQNPDHPLLLCDQFRVEQMHWLVDAGDRPSKCAVKTRYRQPDLACEIRSGAERAIHVRLDAPARAVTPGQYAVFYARDRCIGGGVIAVRAEMAYNQAISAEAQ